MSRKPLELSGQRFGRLVAIARHSENTNQGRARWICNCDCGKTSIVPSGNLKSGIIRSCGCLSLDANITHGLRHSDEYRIWSGIKQRCCNEKNPAYLNYGARGITMCDEWKESFEAFYRDMGSKPSDKHSIDRKDNDKGYCKENCRWATPVEQANNKRKTVFYYYNGTYKTLSAWCRELGLSYKTIYNRVCIQGLSLEDAISVNKQSSKGINYV